MNAFHSPTLNTALRLRLALLDIRFRQAVLHTRSRRGERADEAFRGLHISDAEIDQVLEEGSRLESLFLGRAWFDLLAENAGKSASHMQADTPAGLERLAATLEKQIEAQEGTAAPDAPLPWKRLEHVLELPAGVLELLFILLAPELELRYEKMLAYLNDDVQRRYVTIDLLLRLGPDSLTARRQGRAHLCSGSPLLKWQLCNLEASSSHGFLSTPMRLDPAIANFLLGVPGPDPVLESLTVSLPPGLSWASAQEGIGQLLALLPNAVTTPLLSLVTRIPVGSPLWPILQLQGRGRIELARLTHLFGLVLERPVHVYSASRLEGHERSAQELLLRVERQARLSQAVVCWMDSEPILEGAERFQRLRPLFLEALSRSQVPQLVCAEYELQGEPAGGLRPWLRVGVGQASYAERRAHWDACLASLPHNIAETNLERLSARFHLSLSQIEQAVVEACATAATRDEGFAGITGPELENTCRRQARPRLGTLARRIEGRQKWEDLILPPRPLEILKLIPHYIDTQSRVLETWGFAAVVGPDRGVRALFAGPPGTGKTMAAGVIAHELKLELYTVDLSSVVSKYIGETEKNLERIFREAEAGDVVLFFDEADALFGKRTEVKDAHDRNANVEVAYLLQRLEAFNGLVIMASNLKQNIDPAFLRRMTFVVDFPSPEEPERLRLWRRMFPPEAPLEPDVDLPDLARRIKLSGGHIRNIALASAFMAARESGGIALRHVALAIELEHQKLGKLSRGEG